LAISTSIGKIYMQFKYFFFGGTMQGNKYKKHKDYYLAVPLFILPGTDNMLKTGLVT
jgi:hypothetical protein